jgi:hypothetical protein
MTLFTLGVGLSVWGAITFLAWCLCRAASSPQHWFDE